MFFSSSATALSVLSLTSFVYAQTCPIGFERRVNWEPCPTKDGSNPTLQCAVLTVPRDYKAGVQSDSYRLKLVRLPATAVDENYKKGRTIFTNPGGPGTSAIGSFIRNNGLEGSAYAIQDIVGAEWDVVSIEPRGVGIADNIYSCKANDGDGPYYPRDPDYTDTEYQSYYDGWRTYGDTCARDSSASTGELIGTVYNARDHMAVADALGQDGLIRYIGYSYGTLLGATIGAYFPTKIDRLVLDGNINPIDYYFGLGDEAADGITGAVGNFFKLCAVAGPSKCALARGTETGAQLLSRWNNLLATLRQQGGDSLTRANNLDDTLVNALTSPSSFASVATQLNQMTQGNYKRAFTAFDPATAPNAAKGANILVGITCGDSSNLSGGMGPIIKSIFKAFLARTSYAIGGLASISYSCAGWSINAKEKPASNMFNEGSIKTPKDVLIVQTKYDPVTPLISGQTSKKAFAKSAIYISEGAGHCTSANPSEKLKAAIKAYFVDGETSPQSVFTDVANPFTDIIPPPPVGGDDMTNPTGGQTTKALEKSGLIEIFHNISSRHVEFRRAVNIVEPGCTPIVGFTTSTTSMSSTTTTSAMTTTSSSASATTTTSEATTTTSSTSTTSSEASTTTSSASPTTTTTSSGSSVSSSTTTSSASTTTSTSGAPTSSTTTTSSETTSRTTTTSSAGTSESTTATTMATSTMTTTTSASPTTSSVSQTSSSTIAGGSTSTGTGGSSTTGSATSGPVTTSGSISTSSMTTTGMSSSVMTSGTLSSGMSTQGSSSTTGGGVTTSVMTSATGTTPAGSIPTTTVYTTVIVDTCTCAAGTTSKTVTVTATCAAGCTAQPTGPPQGYTVTSVMCNNCPTPGTVVVTRPVGTTSPANAPGVMSTPVMSTAVVSTKSAIPNNSGTVSNNVGGAGAGSAPTTASTYKATSSGAATFSTYKGAATSNGLSIGGIAAAVLAYVIAV